GTVEVTKVDQTTAGGTWNFDLNAPERDGEDTLDEQFSIVGDGTETRTGVPAGDYSVTETNPGEYGSIEQCPEPNPNGEGVYTTVATPFGTSIDEPGKLIRFVFTNTSCPVVLATGNLVIEKWNDVDGDGNRDAGEDPIGGWEVTVTGPQFPGGATFTTESNPNDLNFGRIILAGIYSGSYNVTEEDPSGWYVTGLIVDGSGKSPSTTTNVEVMDDSLSSYNDAVVEFGNRETASVRVTKVVNDQVGNADRSGWVFTLTGCGILKTASTGASGVILWENLVPCLYTVREAGANQDGFTTSPSAQQSVRPGPGETAEVTFTNSRLPETTPPPSSTPPTNTPTATPVTPTSTPTEPPVEPTNTPTPVETVAGEKTPGPGNQATPIPPDTGSGLGGGATGSSMLLVILGLAAVTAGAGFVSLGRKRR
ncbi:MAG: hypothetical protein KC470_09685, partial [Dehalococcoidia bacterium]|nr:hypothetical protein [Dehalococcoidia bacterium]